MKPQIKDLTSMKGVGLPTTFISILSPEKNNFTVIPKLWGEYMPRAHEIKARKGPIDLGLCECIPESERKHPEECFYLAGTEVLNFDSPTPPGMIAKKCPQDATLCSLTRENSTRSNTP